MQIMGYITGQSVLSCRIDGDRLEVIIDWTFRSASPAMKNLPARPAEIMIDGGWIDEIVALTALRQSQIEQLYSQDVFMRRLMIAAQEDIQCRSCRDNSFAMQI